jgi:RNA polymerase primary sigma factor
MAIHELEKIDSTWKALLDCPEAKVLSATEERDLLIELVDHRERLVEALRQHSGMKWDGGGEGTEFQKMVRELASSATRFDPPAEPLQPLAFRYQEVRTRLVMANVRLVAHVAKRYQGRGVSPGDLIQEGICALLMAIDRFDLVNPTRLATYAIWWIRQGIQRAVAAGAYPVRLNPRHLRQLARAHEGSTEGHRNQPAIAELPRSPRSQTVESLLAATRPTLSLDAPCRYDGATTVIEFLKPFNEEDPRSEDPDESVVKLVSTLDPRERVVLNLRFGLGGTPCQTLVQVSRVLGVSKERVRQIQVRAMRKLQTSPVGKEHHRQFRDSDPAVLAFHSEAHRAAGSRNGVARPTQGCPRAS